MSRVHHVISWRYEKTDAGLDVALPQLTYFRNHITWEIKLHTLDAFKFQIPKCIPSS